MSKYPLQDAVARAFERMPTEQEQVYTDAAQVAFLVEDQIPDDNQFTN